MKIPDSIEDISWGNLPGPTTEELHLSGGLLVEDWPHARQVARLSTELFAATYPLHQMGKKELRLLDRAAFLHNTGMMVETRRHHKHSFRLIRAAPLPDFTEKERYEIACIARYHRRALPSPEHEEFAALSHAARKRVSVLAALLRIADALDYSHDGRVLNVEADAAACTKTIWTLVLSLRPLADFDEELERVYEKADLFEKVFARKLRLVVRA
jgi:exopolyphosphatase/pppGpp-phosphohydrolase